MLKLSLTLIVLKTYIGQQSDPTAQASAPLSQTSVTATPPSQPQWILDNQIDVNAVVYGFSPFASSYTSIDLGKYDSPDKTKSYTAIGIQTEKWCFIKFTDTVTYDMVKFYFECVTAWVKENVYLTQLSKSCPFPPTNDAAGAGGVTGIPMGVQAEELIETVEPVTTIYTLEAIVNCFTKVAQSYTTPGSPNYSTTLTTAQRLNIVVAEQTMKTALQALTGSSVTV